MDQTAVFIDMVGKTTIDFVGNPTIDVVQGGEINGFRASVFLTASGTGQKLPPLIVFAGVPGGPVSHKVWNPKFGSSDVLHTVQKKAWCDEAVMLEWIERIWRPSISSCRLLILNSLKVHKMDTVRHELQERSCTQVEFVPPSVTGICQPMDVAVMKPFKGHICYEKYHQSNPFPKNADERRELLSRFVSEAWGNVSGETIRKGFIRAGIMPYGPRDRSGRFRVQEVSGEDAPIVHPTD
ncbi:hypothetical protein PR003_g24647 [Phytophthora rubi]|uniref:DDE-1 domain-containing protein n=1 Tax=Phytophthora rubi TaxID=129364 RepID=A0A6A4CV66_9STRA|nr:hypothetical protein PR001_g23450 [Phytophthora rubi]KAE9292874.1 hypothetical protein PR003_g24647 [Phytophthora rubi]